MLRLKGFAKAYTWPVLGAVVLLFVQAFSELALPGYMSDIVNRGVLQGDTEEILKLGGFMLGVTLLSLCCSVAVGFLASRTAAGVSRDLRRALFEKVQSFSNREFDTFSASSLITRTTNDVTQIQQLLVMMIRMVFYAPILAVGGFLHALDKSPSMSWIIGVGVLMVIGIVSLVFTLAIPRFKRIQKIIDRMNAVVRENLEGMLVIRAFNTRKFEEERFDKVNQELTSVTLFVHRVLSGMMPAMFLLMNLVTIVVVWVGAGEIAASHLNVGDLMAYIQYVMQIIMAFLFMSMMFIQIPRASISAGRIADVLETELSVKDVKSDGLPSEGKGEGLLVFEHVSFSYPGAESPVLKDISFTARPGETTAIIGPTGSGKTTIANLIPRFYDVCEGQITIDGVDIGKIPLFDLRKKLGFVPQKAMLFSGSIRSNLAYGDESAGEGELLGAAAVAQALDFIEEKPEGLDAPIAQKGANVSGGQKQRLSIARALLREPQIYIFDDCFSALDYGTDARLRAALRERTRSAAILMIAQRIHTIRDAAQILVLDQGRIVGRGTHQELLQTCGLYREIASSQLGEGESL